MEGKVVEVMTKAPEPEKRGTGEPVICKTEGCKVPANLRKNGKLVNGYCPGCMAAIMNEAKKKKKVKGKKAKLSSPATHGRNIVLLDLTDYPEIKSGLVETAAKMLVPVQHVVLSMLGEALARKRAEPSEIRCQKTDVR